MKKYLSTLIISLVGAILFSELVFKNQFLLFFIYVASVIIMDYNTKEFSKVITKFNQKLFIFLILFLYTTIFLSYTRIYDDGVSYVIIKYTFYFDILFSSLVAHTVYNKFFVEHYVSKSF